ncbi:hypothetical protein JQ612_11550 [Bradyrhizobium manausense]|uniref:hypothetical protein n=1 Tax=Bradyrhizobium manausense TaxID=989370 RepID=UPI001BAA29F6|nr:hypothetical protein [Bradyrhizobium manausense]MBR0720845.1 hypothetical protein [Bradyrhizobium manausense]MBR0833830.1 hypothetical protein [Bradyrhizobium manausense]
MWVTKALGLIVVAAIGYALLFGGYEDPRTLYFPALALFLFAVFFLRPARPVHPYVIVFLTLLATLIFSALYGIFGIGQSALVLSATFLIVCVTAIVIPFGIAAVSAYVRSMGRRKR